jgi:hypothetical protein
MEVTDLTGCCRYLLGKVAQVAGPPEMGPTSPIARSSGAGPPGSGSDASEERTCADCSVGATVARLRACH